jgi:hypothetical protein
MLFIYRCAAEKHKDMTVPFIFIPVEIRHSIHIFKKLFDILKWLLQIEPTSN